MNKKTKGDASVPKRFSRSKNKNTLRERTSKGGQSCIESKVDKMTAFKNLTFKKKGFQRNSHTQTTEIPLNVGNSFV